MSVNQMVSMVLMVWNMIVFLTYGLDKERLERMPIEFLKKPYC